MADVAHTIPADLKWLERSKMGFDRPGVQVSNYITGPVLSRDFGRYNLRSYTINPSIISDDNLMSQWEMFWKHINGGADVGYIVEPISTFCPELVCGPITDASRTAFGIPASDVSDVIVMIDGVPRPSSEYTLHAASTLLADDKHSDPVSDGDFTVQNGTETIATGFSYIGKSSLKVVPDTVAATIGYPGGFCPSTVGETYTTVVAVYETMSSPRTFTFGHRWYTAAPAFVSATTTTGVAVRGWNIFTHTAVAPATSTQFLVQIGEPGATTDPWYADAFAGTPDNYDRSFLPSQAPAVIEFNSAPSANQRVTVSCTGKRVTRCRFGQSNTWSYSSIGNATVQAIRADEVLEF